MPRLQIGPATNRAAMILAVTETRASDQAEAVSYLKPAFAAADEGHTVVWDPPACNRAPADRWTCVACGRAAVYHRGTLYGGAIGEPCPGRRP